MAESIRRFVTPHRCHCERPRVSRGRAAIQNFGLLRRLTPRNDAHENGLEIEGCEAYLLVPVGA